MRRFARARELARFSLLAAVTFYPAWFLAAVAVDSPRLEAVLGVDVLWALALWAVIAAPFFVLGACLVQVTLLWVPRSWPRLTQQGLHVAAGLIVVPLALVLSPGVIVSFSWEGVIALLAGLVAWVTVLPRVEASARR